MYAALPNFFGINYTVIGFIRCAESRKLIRVCRPVEIAGIYDRTAQRHRMTVHIFGGGMRYDIDPPFERIAVDRGRERVVND